ncbi:glycoside hydrolase family 3 [Prosthecochloris marina]|uniref:beta-N-acetylhexosaminidase n=2 Tax=Chlorobiaceae TaxID=191412 RepID=A0A317TB70_9CHLB|nr:glycoside hydrolase family 3 [Prosthecochloris marina]
MLIRYIMVAVLLLLHIPALALCHSVYAEETPAYTTATAQEIFSRKDKWVEKQLKKMTLSEKIGQMLIAHSPAKFQSADNKEYRKLFALIKEGKVGGVMFLKGNTYDAAVLANRFQLIAPRPLLISADMEKGLAMRIEGTTEFAPNMALSATANPELVHRMAEVIAREAKALGIHQSYAPNVDLNINPLNPVINTRSYGDNIPLVIEMTKAFIDGLQSKGMIATAKHFPGHGDVTVDSHVNLPVLQADKKRLDNVELKPFKAAIEHGVMSVMTGHLAVPKITGNMTPATLSWRIVTKLLRKELDFEGLIVTDALNMKALYQNYTLEDISLRAVEAGNDLLLFSPDPELTHNTILNAVRNGKLSEKQIDKSVRRILLAKRWLGLDQNRLVNLNGIPQQISLQSHRQLAETIANRSITVVRDNKDALPLKKKDNILHIILENKRHSLSGETFSKKMRRTFLAKTIRIGADANSLDYRNAIDKAKRASAVIVSTYVEVLSGAKSLELSGRQQDFINKLTRDLPSKRPLIMISFGTPYLINQFPGMPAYICTYSSSELSEDAAIRLLKGDITPAGKLPISLTTNLP